MVERGGAWRQGGTGQGEGVRGSIILNLSRAHLASSISWHRFSKE